MLFLKGPTKANESLHIGHCDVCANSTLWIYDPAGRHRLAWPPTSLAPQPNPDLPENIRRDYEEAADIAARSPRSAAALLRLCVQKLCVHFGQPGRNINDDIRALVKSGKIRPMLQQAMDTVRISGNESVHPGELDLTDDSDLVSALFEFVNLIADEAITLPAKVQMAFDRMPETKKIAVAQQDGFPTA